jgi:hypothetical protein
MIFVHKIFPCYLLFIISIVCSFSPDTSSFDAYGLKLAANDLLLVESLNSDSSFFLRLSPYNYSLSCTIPYNDSNQYVFAVSLASQSTSNDIIRFVFIGIDTVTDVPFIGSLTYVGVTGAAYLAIVKSSRKFIFPCNGWQMNNYRIHQLQQFTTADDDENRSNDFFVVKVV